MKDYDLKRMKYRVEFGKYKNSGPEAGSAVFVPMAKVWCGLYKLSTSQIIAAGSTLEGMDHTKLIAIRHKDLDEFTHAMFNDDLYTIQKIESDDSLNGFDVVSLQLVQ